MALKDLFTGSGTARAEKQIRSTAGQAHDTNQQVLQHAFDSAIHTLTGGRDAASAVLRGGKDEALAALDEGVTGARGALESAGNRFAGVEGLAGDFGGATNLLLDALGVRGSEGAARASEAFNENRLSSNFVTEQGFKDLIGARRAAGDGTFQGGNLDRELLEFGQDRARSDVDSFISQLSQFINPTLSATSTAAAGRASADTGIADLLDSAGRTRAGLAQSTADRIADLAAGTSGSIASLQSNRGLANIDQRNRFIDSLSGSLRNEAAGRGQGSANLIASLLAGGNLIGDIAGQRSEL